MNCSQCWVWKKLLPNCFDRHEKESASISECFRAVALCVKCLTKRDKVWGRCNDAGYVEDNLFCFFLFFPRGWISVFQSTHLDSLLKRKKREKVGKARS